jgi:hypothetical protein
MKRQTTHDRRQQSPARAAVTVAQSPVRAGKRGTQLDPDDDSRSVVNSLAEGLRVLEAFSAEHPELTLSEVPPEELTEEERTALAMTCRCCS